MVVVRQEGAWLNNACINLVLAAALPELMMGLTTYPEMLGAGTDTRVLSTDLLEALYWSGVDVVLANSTTWGRGFITQRRLTSGFTQERPPGSRLAVSVAPISPHARCELVRFPRRSKSLPKRISRPAHAPGTAPWFYFTSWAYIPGSAQAGLCISLL